MPNPLLVSALPSMITAGAGLLGSLFGGSQASANTKSTNAANLEIARQNNATSMQIAKENNALQLQMMRENNDWSRQQALEMFNLENEYNTPAAQKQRLIEAGLNPATMYGAGGAVAGSGDIATPSAAGSTISPSMPNLVSPTMQVPPSPVSAMFQNFGTFASALSSLSHSKLEDSQRNRIETLLGAEFEDLSTKIKFTEAQTSYQNVLNMFEQMYGHSQRSANVQKTLNDALKSYNDAILAVLKGDTELAEQALKHSQAYLETLNAKKLGIQIPFVAEEMKQGINLLIEKQETEKSNQASNYASAKYSNSLASYTDEQRSQLEAMAHDNIEINRLTKQEKVENIVKIRRTLILELEHLERWNEIEKLEADKLREEINRLSFENGNNMLNHIWSKMMELTKAGASLVPFMSGNSSAGQSVYSSMWSTSSTR